MRITLPETQKHKSTGPKSFLKIDNCCRVPQRRIHDFHKCGGHRLKCFKAVKSMIPRKHSLDINLPFLHKKEGDIVNFNSP